MTKLTKDFRDKQALADINVQSTIRQLTVDTVTPLRWEHPLTSKLP